MLALFKKEEVGLKAGEMDITPSFTANIATQIEAGQRHILELTAMDTPLPIVLKQIVLFIESITADSFCSILLFDQKNNSLHLGAAPHLPPEYNAAIDGVRAGPTVGSCGAAASLRTDVIVESIATHPNWAAFKDMALSHDLKACWSSPIFSPKGEVFGTFAIYYQSERSPTSEEKELVKIATHIASLAIHRQQLTASLLDAKKNAERADQCKSDFLANMSHELRTPLTSILGYAELLKSDALSSDDRSRFLNSITLNGNQLIGIINDILDLSKVESGKESYEFSLFSLSQLVADITSSFALEAEKKGIELKYVIPDIPIEIYSDQTRVGQIITNIIVNALKFTEHGSVKVELLPPSPDGNVKIEIHDTGVGISTENRARLFERFSQLSGDSKYGGTGLGLTLSRTFARALGGDLELKESQPGRGTTFSIRLAQNAKNLSSKIGAVE